MFYCIRYRYAQERLGIFSNLPVTSEVTTDKNTAETWFDNAVRVHTLPWKGNKLEFVRERKPDYMCCIKEAMFRCCEPGQKQGWYIIELGCYTSNPFPFM